MAKAINQESDRNFIRKYLKQIVFVLIIILAATSFYFYNKYQKANSLLQNPTQQSSEESKALVTAVGKLIELPKENPTIATVTDKTKLEDQPFFAQAQNGDKVLIFSNAQKAILYRPSTNKIINVGPVNLGQNQVSPTIGPTATQTPTPSIESPQPTQ